MNLFEITKQAKINPEKTSVLIKAFVEKKFNVEISELSINSCAVSLNSVNGKIILEEIDGIRKKLFFKFHAEEGEENSVDEYYRSGILEKAGYPVITPLYESKIPGEQFLIYEFVDQPTFYDAFGDIDAKFLETGKYDEEKKEALLNAEREFCEISLEIAKKTLHVSDAKTVAEEDEWQLFYKRLVSENIQDSESSEKPRVDLFYTDKSVKIPENTKNPGERCSHTTNNINRGNKISEINFEEFKHYTWVINGKKYSENLAEIIESAKKIVNPNAQKNWATITAHGDDHNGNKFYFEGETPSLKFFDPAFAGENIPALLAFVKTTFHDTLAHPFYFYEPEKVEEKAEISVEINKANKTVVINHKFNLEESAPFRKELLEIKKEKLWKPLIQEMKSRNFFPEISEKNQYTWEKQFIKKALFCCPFLCLNLIDKNKFSPKTSLFALSRAVELGSSIENKNPEISEKNAPEKNMIDQFLDDILN